MMNPTRNGVDVDDATRDALSGLSMAVLRAIAPQVGGPRVVAAAPEIMVALGLSVPEGTQP